jgi:hypothetical protein
MAPQVGAAPAVERPSVVDGPPAAIAPSEPPELSEPSEPPAAEPGPGPSGAQPNEP